MVAGDIDIENPRYDQSTFVGRAKHFFITTNPLNCLATEAQLDESKRIVDAYRRGEKLDISEDKLWEMKQLYDSAFHPQSGEKLFLPGRMSFQVPGNMLITGCMLTFYKTAPAVVFWQFANQSFNAIVNFSNRNASAGVSNEQLGLAYAAASTASVGTALFFNKIVNTVPALGNGVVGRLVPFMAVAAANCVNLPLMRQQEIKNGIAIETADGQVVGESTVAAVNAVSQVVFSRIGMAVPGMTIPPLIMSRIEKASFIVKNPWIKAPLTVALTGLCITFSTPLCCALFPQKASINLSDLEDGLRQKVAAKYPQHTTFYYNKGL
mmetsp:Transcript_21614/g.31453  ORF Transcript_21614/g.31453 Transcript_21614/m.31453 type:complete len:323 (-) Transcript_21614:263-1231(-)